MWSHVQEQQSSEWSHASPWRLRLDQKGKGKEHMMYVCLSVCHCAVCYSAYTVFACTICFCTVFLNRIVDQQRSDNDDEEMEYEWP